MLHPMHKALPQCRENNDSNPLIGDTEGSIEEATRQGGMQDPGDTKPGGIRDQPPATLHHIGTVSSKDTNPHGLQLKLKFNPLSI